MLKLLLLTISTLVASAGASPFTFVLKADEKACFYETVDKPRSSVGYYFAVQSGGSFDVDYSISGPDGKQMVHETKQRQGDWVFNAEKAGEYEFCFSNEMSTYAEKVVDFEITLETGNSEPIDSSDSRSDSILSSVGTINDRLNGILKKLQYYKTRNNRNQATVRSTESRIFYFSFYEVLLIVGMAVFQVVVVKLFFNGRKQYV